MYCIGLIGEIQYVFFYWIFGGKMIYLFWCDIDMVGGIGVGVVVICVDVGYVIVVCIFYDGYVGFYIDFMGGVVVFDIGDFCYGCFFWVLICRQVIVLWLKILLFVVFFVFENILGVGVVMC